MISIETRVFWWGARRRAVDDGRQVRARVLSIDRKYFWKTTRVFTRVPRAEEAKRRRVRDAGRGETRPRLERCVERHSRLPAGPQYPPSRRDAFPRARRHSARRVSVDARRSELVRPASVVLVPSVERFARARASSRVATFVALSSPSPRTVCSRSHPPRSPKPSCISTRRPSSSTSRSCCSSSPSCHCPCSSCSPNARWRASRRSRSMFIAVVYVGGFQYYRLHRPEVTRGGLKRALVPTVVLELIESEFQLRYLPIAADPADVAAARAAIAPPDSDADPFRAESAFPSGRKLVPGARRFASHREKARTRSVSSFSSSSSLDPAERTPHGPPFPPRRR